MSALADLTFLSVDVETSTKVAGTGSLLSFGIVPVIHRDGTWVSLLSGPTLYVRLEHNVRFEHHYAPAIDSVGWWSEQDPTVRDEAFDQNRLRFPEKTAAWMVVDYVKKLEPDPLKVIFAANPVSFDKPWMDMLIARAGLELPWHYRSLCLRSMKFGMDISAGFGADRTTHPSSLPHHALHDAIAQSYDLIDMLNTGGA